MSKELETEAFIYHGPGGCPKCGGQLIVADSEITLMELNQDGIPISEETNVKCRAVCRDCGHRMNMVRWNGGYIPYSTTSLLMKIMEQKELNKQRISSLNKNAKSNPFEY